MMHAVPPVALRLGAGLLLGLGGATGNWGTTQLVRQLAARRHAGRARAVLDDAAKRKAARIAVAEVQQHHAVWSMAQLRFEVHRALPVLPPGADGEAVVTEVVVTHR